MAADQTSMLLDHFAAEVRQVAPIVALWAHGSLALGDFQPQRSDLDLIALMPAEVDAVQRAGLRDLHRRLAKASDLGSRLHCTYVDRARLHETHLRHPTWAQGRFFDRPVSPVSRRELTTGGLSLSGPAPAGVVPAVSDRELADFIRADLRDFWYPATARRLPWRREVWVDLGPVTVARAGVTLRDGRLITKAQALEVLPTLGAPPELIDDIRRRRYETPGRTSLRWRIERAALARRFVRTRIERLLDSP